MRMGDRDEFYVGGLDAKLIELARKRFWPTPVCGLRISRCLAVRHGGNCVSDARIPQQPTLCVMDEIAVIDEVHRLADVNAGRPKRNVAGNSFTAIEYVEPIHAGFGLRGCFRRMKQCRDDGDEKA